jgi:hypothetical protein
LFARSPREVDLNYVSNSIFPEAQIALEPYLPGATRRLGLAVSQTLDIEPDWFEY